MRCFTFMWLERKLQMFLKCSKTHNTGIHISKIRLHSKLLGKNVMFICIAVWMRTWVVSAVMWTIILSRVVQYGHWARACICLATVCVNHAPVSRIAPLTTAWIPSAGPGYTQWCSNSVVFPPVRRLTQAKKGNTRKCPLEDVLGVIS